MSNSIDSLCQLIVRLGEKKVKTNTDIALWRDPDGTWSAAFGGHGAVMLGEWAGDFHTDYGDDHKTPESALEGLLEKVCAAK